MQITIQSTYESVRSADEALRALLSQAGVSESLSPACELAVHELLTNLVDHAYTGDPTGKVEVEMTVTEQSLRVQTRDTGIPPNLDLYNISMPNPEDLAEGGYGLAIILTLMDEVSYQTQNGQNLWHLVKKF